MSKLTNFQTITTQTALTVGASNFASGDVMVETEAITIAGTVNPQGLRGSIVYAQLLDEGDNQFATNLFFLSSNVALGTADAAISITDANARNLLGVVSFATGSSWVDLQASQIQRVQFNPIPFNLTDGDIYVAVSAGEASDRTSSGANSLYLTLGFVIDNLGYA